MAATKTDAPNETLNGSERTKQASGVVSTSDASPKLRWDESRSRTISPTVCTISATREEFALLFSSDRRRAVEDQERTANLTERIILSPFLVKKVASLLREAVSRWELKFGPLILDSPASSPASPSLPGKGRRLFDLVTSLNVETALEHSFKMSEGCFFENRFLLAVRRDRVDAAIDKRVGEVCALLAMPSDFVQTFSHHLPDANHIYFGFEENERTSLYKVYLEFRDRAEEIMKADANPSGPHLLHVGFKWDSGDSGRKAETRYEWFPALPVREIMARLPSMLVRRPGQDPLGVAEAIIGLASERLKPEDIQYVEVSEEGNARKSFDINLYKAGVLVREVQPFLTRMAEYYDLDPNEFHIFCEQIGSKKFGHLAGGIDREGQDFMTVYYGVEYIQGVR